jgi:hypothetical protein
MMRRKKCSEAQSHYTIRLIDASALEANSSVDVMDRT